MMRAHNSRPFLKLLWRGALAAALFASLGITMLAYTQPDFVFDLANRWIMCF
jgi:hypothetical protein